MDPLGICVFPLVVVLLFVTPAFTDSQGEFQHTHTHRHTHTQWSLFFLFEMWARQESLLREIMDPPLIIIIILKAFLMKDKFRVFEDVDGNVTR